VSVRPCYFIVYADGTFWRITKKKFYRILQPREGDTNPEFKSQRIKYAAINVDYDGRRPLSVHSADFGVITFDENGCLDETEQLRYEQLMMDTRPSATGLQPRAAKRLGLRAQQQIDREFGIAAVAGTARPTLRSCAHNKLVGGSIH
jgi:hypothetical protein